MKQEYKKAICIDSHGTCLIYGKVYLVREYKKGIRIKFGKMTYLKERFDIIAKEVSK
jgi:hypothetical protein